MNNIVNTRISIRNDELSNWVSSDVTLLKGELALARRPGGDDEGAGTYELRIGVGDKKWQELDPGNFAISASQVIGLSSTVSQLSTAHYEAASLDQLSNYSTYNNGDTAVVKALIAGEGADAKYSYTAYVWNSELTGDNKWAAMDGNYRADNVYFPNDMTMTYQFGKYTVPSTGSYVLSSQGKSVAEVIADAYAETKSGTKSKPAFSFSYGSSGTDEVGKTYTLPSATLKMTSIGKYEYGTTVNPSTGNNNTGISVAVEDAYVTHPETGTLSNSTAMTLNSTLTAAAGTTTHTYTDETVQYTYSAAATWSDGDIPLNNVGGADPSNKISSDTSSFIDKQLSFTGYRKTFYGTLTAQVGEGTDGAGIPRISADSAMIRGLAKSTSSAAGAGTKLTVDIPVGAKSVVFAYPATLRDVSSVIDSATKYEIKSSFNTDTAGAALSVDVEGANSYTAKTYKVYYSNFANPTTDANSYVVTI